MAGCALVGKGAGRKTACSRIADLSSAGEHKPAMDAASELEKEGKSCPPEVLEAVSESRSRVQKADGYVHKALRRKKEGNLLSARSNLERALSIYPRYYWVQTLLKNMERSIQAERDSLISEARYLESRDDPEGAIARIREAIRLSPGDPALESEAARLEEEARKSVSEEKVQSLLQEAGTHLEAGRFEEAQRLLTMGDSPQILGERGQKLLSEVTSRRREHLRLRFRDAQEKERAGDLEAAATHTLFVLELAVPGEEITGQIVEFARLLGMKLYSAGALTRAKELWSSAILVDPGNTRLQGYLQEVQTRLENLNRIKSGKTGADGN